MQGYIPLPGIYLNVAIHWCTSECIGNFFFELAKAGWVFNFDQFTGIDQS